MKAMAASWSGKATRSLKFIRNRNTDLASGAASLGRSRQSCGTHVLPWKKQKRRQKSGESKQEIGEVCVTTTTGKCGKT